MSLPPRPRIAFNRAMRAAVTVLLGATCAAGFGVAAWADSIDNGGFEGFALGNPVGQFGWTAHDIGAYNAAGFDIAIADPSLVWTGGELGTKALRVSNGKNTSGGFGNQLQTPSLVDEAGEAEADSGGLSGGTRQSRFSGSFDFASATKTYQPGLSMSMAPDRGDGARMGYIRIADRLDGLEVSIAYVEAIAPYNFNTVVVASGLSRDEVHHFEFTLDFVDGPANDVLWSSVGGECSSFASSGSWEEYHRHTDEGASPHGTKTVDSIMFRISGDPVPANLNGGLFFDHFEFGSSTVPPMPPLGTPAAPKTPSANVNFTSVAVTGTPVATNACAPITTYTVSAWPLGGGAPATFTSPTPTFSFPTPFEGAFTLTMSATNSQGTSAEAPVSLFFDPVFAGDNGSGSLAATGANTSALLAAATVTIIIGTVMLVTRRRHTSRARVTPSHP